jgi:threonine/homoserine/homoserine lactone efflux protein
MSLEFWITSFVVVVVPGTGVIYTVSSGISGGLKKGLWAVFGCTVGIVPHIAASLVGLSALLNASAMAFSILKLIGVGYLLFLAWQMWNDKSDYSSLSKTKETSGFSTFRRGFLMNILNPKLTIFFLAFLPQFVSRGKADVTLQMIALSLCFMILTLLVFLLYALLAHTFREVFIKSPKFKRIMNKTFAGILTFFGVELALSEK